MRLLSSLTLLIVLSTAVPTGEAAPPAGLGPVSGRVIWVDFWASWCVPCRRSFPWLNAMHRQYGPEGLQIIAVNLDKERALADGFLAEIPADFSVLFDPAGKLAKAFVVQAMPSSYLLAADGTVLASHFGFKTADAPEYERAIEDALAAARPKN
ncbi:MAG TPA: TlpA disulfide reductase family protein [Gammaproteobacteria bacterium]|nr:TlpA disulfide reductase family protein [Gammaproteobacteria bacterium]